MDFERRVKDESRLNPETEIRLTFDVDVGAEEKKKLERTCYVLLNVVRG